MSKPREIVELRRAPYISNRAARWDRVIDKWVAIVRILKDGKTPTNTDAVSCAFCEYDYQHPHEDACYGCPIAKDATPGCSGTPYSSFARAMERRDYVNARKHARAELRYLRKLRRQEGI